MMLMANDLVGPRRFGHSLFNITCGFGIAHNLRRSLQGYLWHNLPIASEVWNFSMKVVDSYGA